MRFLAPSMPGAALLSSRIGAERPSLRLDFLSAQINPIIGGGTTTVTTSANATIINSAGLVAAISANQPRFDYNPVTLACRGLLQEEQRDNRCLHNRDKSNAVWTKTGVTVSAATNWSGVSTNIRLTASGANGTCLQSITNASVERTYSVAIKRVTGTGTISITLDNGATWTDITSQINNSAFTVVKATQTLANPVVGVRISTSGDAVDVDLDQEETGAFFTSRIITGATAVTRAADVAYLATLGSWWNAAEGTFVVGFTSGQAGQTVDNYLLRINDGTGNEDMIVYRQAGTNTLRFYGADGGVVQWDATSGTQALGLVTAKIAAAYRVNDIQISGAGAAVASDVAATLPTVAQLLIGSGGAAGHPNGWITGIEYFSRHRGAELTRLSV